MGKHTAFVPTIQVGYYERGHSESRLETTGRIHALCQQLSMISDQLSLALRRRDAIDAVRLVQYHHENFVFRTYAMLEQAWDALAALVDIPRESTTKKSFRKSVLSKVASSYPELHAICTELHSLTTWDERVRHVATHETSLYLLLMFDEHNWFEADTFLLDFPRDSEQKAIVQDVAKKALRRFVAEDKKHIDEIVKVAWEFVRYFVRGPQKQAESLVDSQRT